MAAAMDFLLARNDVHLDKAQDGEIIYWILGYKKKRFLGHGSLEQYEEQLEKFVDYIQRVEC